MYQALLIWRYLTSKIMPLLAALAVMLCVTMELIVWSVMGGFLVMLLASGRSLIGDVSISFPYAGFAHYGALIERLQADELVDAAAPMIETAGMISLPGDRIQAAQVRGVEPGSFDRVTGYTQNLWWHPLRTPLPKDKAREDPRLHAENRAVLEMTERAGRELVWPEDGRPAIIAGIEVSPKWGLRRPEGWIDASRFLPRRQVTLTLPRFDSVGRPAESSTRAFVVGNEARTGLFEVDANTVLAPLDVVQRMLGMHEKLRLETGEPTPRLGIDPETGRRAFVLPPAAEVDPARVTTVLVRAREGVSADVLRGRAREVYAAFAAEFADEPSPPPHIEEMQILTWEDRNATLIGAVKKETALVMFIFGVISLTSVFLVLAIFWAMVSEKTKDIGVLRSIGAGRAGIAGLWLGYGLAIGVVGAALGGGLAYAIVRNINPIHEWIGRTTGEFIWDPAVYYFSDIPNRVDPVNAAIVIALGIAASVAGALGPAMKAARMDPVKALRFE